MRISGVVGVLLWVLLDARDAAADEKLRVYVSIYGGNDTPNATEAIVASIESCAYLENGTQRHPTLSMTVEVKYCGCMQDAIRGGSMKIADLLSGDAAASKIPTNCLNNAKKYQDHLEPTYSPYQPRSGDWTAERIYYAYRGAERRVGETAPEYKSLPIEVRLDFVACMVDHMRHLLVELGFSEKKMQSLGPVKANAAISKVMPSMEAAMGRACLGLLPKNMR